jgi:hypothetical protein
LLSLTYSGALEVAPIAGKISEMRWLKNAAEFVQKQLDQIKNS